MRTMVRVFSGEYDLTYKSQLRSEFDTMCEEPHLVLDIRGVSYVDWTFATELLRLYNLRAEKGIGEVSIVRGAAAVSKLFTTLYFKTLFRLVDTLEEVLPGNGSTVVIQCACRGDAAAESLPAWSSLGLEPGLWKV